MKKASSNSGIYKEYLYDLGGQMMAEVDSNGNWIRGEVYAAGMHVATYADGTTYFPHTDWLGSARTLSGPAGTALSNCTSLPFGDGQNCTALTSERTLFATYERDGESGLDHALFRQYSPTWGRFTSPDPLGGNIGSPQSLNRYTYALNDPINNFDPDGADCAEVHLDGVRLPCQESNGGGGGGGFGSNWDPFDVLNFAFTPTFGIITIDPEDFSNLTLHLFFGNWDIASFVLAGLPSSIGHELGPNGKSLAGCARGLKTKKSNMAAVDRANANMATIQQAASANGVDPAILAAIGVRETNFQNISQLGGQGAGTFQIDLGRNLGVSQEQAFNLNFSTNFAANLLARGTNKYSVFGPQNSVPAGIRGYNTGPNDRYTFGKMSGGIPSLDRGTTGNNYVSNVLDLADCFQ